MSGKYLRKYLEEGETCPECEIGVMGYEEVENCSCHIHPPCSACVEQLLTCLKCSYEHFEGNGTLYI